MKVVVNSPTVNLQPVDKGSKRVSPGNLAAASGAMQDRTTLHTDTLSVQSLTAQALNSPEIRQDKVDALTLSIQNGEYKANSSGTVDAISKSENL